MTVYVVTVQTDDGITGDHEVFGVYASMGLAQLMVFTEAEKMAEDIEFPTDQAREDWIDDKVREYQISEWAVQGS